MTHPLYSESELARLHLETQGFTYEGGLRREDGRTWTVELRRVEETVTVSRTDLPGPHAYRVTSERPAGVSSVSSHESLRAALDSLTP
ncbi:hypothetical protein [Deinococcus soli (ex Cha et al. 2016)]|uniref:Uncharacterized protein n=2 Tax=Deinococcus soli (ex Cha et al. 2016) TaxID=1309411 RepID=A0AAE4BKS8_9DEIO|nr:hypothetical protein [Deinococcus soli (ex Cha et al. 2016)]MDR6218118.1 hypothetical protein [Deinococcus soli (ex Cha et al. 2016)]MDR6328858.1 hypothetical protein [Deinococcus soli (ex Cha et al. 2016)]MDR6751654.1 hypothetical protein [Deinococcus soli (ex Cha et al. 2016)]